MGASTPFFYPLHLPTTGSHLTIDLPHLAVTLPERSRPKDESPVVVPEEVAELRNDTDRLPGPVRAELQRLERQLAEGDITEKVRSGLFPQRDTMNMMAGMAQL